ncbi:winged helix-turn-helix transcriptional regulator [Rufibacter quisquiliarum]|uniref:DNA-binding HxlR family transcriptional regulator n=1 Tax=Rufibacter quisquiliarum TaxID=1549639 RepID=A0A839GY95_9BACT|nr:helix-turn-helix domain-containing protein [Rufibacter quisquiliarum]MBA9079676.1 DNA-binding HxlR family transcriptional regulator [Rufibacter quisquiliarum]
MALSKLEYSPVQCSNRLSATEDAIYVLGGKWTIRVMIGILGGNTRFNELQRALKSISAKSLSIELKKLEENHLVERKVYPDQTPVMVEYIPTEYSHSLKDVITALTQWGAGHKRKIMDLTPQEQENELG